MSGIFPAVRVLGVDFGRKKIGLALSDPLGMAHPLGTEKVSGLHNTVETILSVVKEKEVSEVVLGYPLKQDGTVGEMALEVEKLAELLKREGLTVVLVDERFSSERAIRSLHIMGKKKGKNKKDIDTMAAALLLQEYLDRKSRERNG
ncbi:MAG TPA: Holliday junction resolvase RuvX [candidate division Zixibacteria bacterium]|nr:Holliday junction resolvase RuvX [candidate division Zixibacteria bacterium]